MIHVDTLPVDVEDMRDWANGYKEMHRLSWKELGELLNIPAGTIQPFCKGNYAGRNDNLAREVFMFKQAEEARANHKEGIPVNPGYFETPTSLRIRSLLAEASTGTITLGCFGPGLGKTVTARDFLGRVSPAWMITMDEVTSTTNAMIRAVEKAIGLNSRNNWPAEISADIINFLRKKRALLIIDEANHLERKALEQLRAWHDATKVGICLLGNEELIVRIEKGRERDAFARLNRRISERVVQNMPEEGDVTAFCDAWGLFDPGIRKLLTEVAMQAASGGLGECEQIITKASVIAQEDGGKLELAHVRWAKDRRVQRLLR